MIRFTAAMIFVANGFAILLVLAIPAAAADPLALYLTAVSQKLDPRAADALYKIEGAGRRLLAARSYLRKADSLPADWSRSERQIAQYQGSPAQQALDTEIERVRREFETRNPGYTLFVNFEVRTVATQIDNWNSNNSVSDAGAELLTATTDFLASGTVPPATTPAGKESFTNFLLRYEPRRKVAIAAPGLSLHGQMRAVDFQVERDGKTVAGPDTATIEDVWLSRGWRDKLAVAVIASSARFVGPLEQPDEPWHYTYQGVIELPSH